MDSKNKASAEEMIMSCMEKIAQRISELAEKNSAESDKSLVDLANGMSYLADALYKCQ